jgi:hypothetical protein
MVGTSNMVTAAQLAIKKACSIAPDAWHYLAAADLLLSCARTAPHAYAANNLLWLHSLPPAAAATAAKDKGPMKDKDV